MTSSAFSGGGERCVMQAQASAADRERRRSIAMKMLNQNFEASTHCVGTDLGWTVLLALFFGCLFALGTHSRS
jgi:hypothetical protein